MFLSAVIVCIPCVMAVRHIHNDHTLKTAERATVPMTTTVTMQYNIQERSIAGSGGIQSIFSEALAKDRASGVIIPSSVDLSAIISKYHLPTPSAPKTT